MVSINEYTAPPGASSEGVGTAAVDSNSNDRDNKDDNDDNDDSDDDENDGGGGGGGGINTLTVAGKDNNQLRGSRRNGGCNCDNNGDGNDGNADGDSCDDEGDDGGGGGGGIDKSGDNDSRGAQTTTTCLYPFQGWLLHPPLSQRENVYRTQVQRTWTYFNLSVFVESWEDHKKKSRISIAYLCHSNLTVDCPP